MYAQNKFNKKCASSTFEGKRHTSQFKKKRRKKETVCEIQTLGQQSENH